MRWGIYDRGCGDYLTGDGNFEPTLHGLLSLPAQRFASTTARVNARFGPESKARRCGASKVERFMHAWVADIDLGAGPADKRRVLFVVIDANAEAKSSRSRLT